MTVKLTKIDELIISDHYYLDATDSCYFIGEYTARGGYGHSETNNLIQNLKKPVDRKGRAEYRHKALAIQTYGQTLRQVLNEDILKSCTFIPVPPSKALNDPLHDPRMMDILRVLASKCDFPLDYRDIVIQAESAEAAHSSQNRKSPDEWYELYQIDATKIDDTKNILVIVDDVLTTGSHFKAMKRILTEQFPGSQIVGLFLARTERSSNVALMFQNLDIN